MKRYPLRDKAQDTLRSHSERPLNQLTADALARGDLSGDDLRTHADTLRAQADIAADAGYPQLGENLRRAAELTAVPNDELLKIYELLRPERATFAELNRLADYLESAFDARENASFIREAARTYRDRDLLRR